MVVSLGEVVDRIESNIVPKNIIGNFISGRYFFLGMAGIDQLA